LLSNAYEDIPEIINLRKASLKESEEVKKEYRRLKAEVGTMRSIPKMVKYLKNLGFDVTWLEEQLKIEEPVEKLDTSKLFVCGENK
jgi:23S rRNA A1618 N6-methylase RlmF